MLSSSVYIRNSTDKSLDVDEIEDGEECNTPGGATCPMTRADSGIVSFSLMRSNPNSITNAASTDCSCEGDPMLAVPCIISPGVVVVSANSTSELRGGRSPSSSSCGVRSVGLITCSTRSSSRSGVQNFVTSTTKP